jgi:hypothetical protein
MHFLITLHYIKYNISNMGLDVDKLWFKMTTNKSLVSIDKRTSEILVMNEWKNYINWRKTTCEYPSDK